MKELVVVSGKGGTGKTSITGALASIIPKPLLVDCDVDAADLHLLLSPETVEENKYTESHVAFIDSGKCTQCGLCIAHCEFDAISDDFVVDPIACEGCGVCCRLCPVEAIDFPSRTSGRWYVSRTRFGIMVHARLRAGEGNSGKLVSVLRNRAKEIARSEEADYILVDGPPGIGCPVISSVTGSDAVLIVTEPTMSGIHDFERISELARHFKLRQFVCINKADVNMELTREIESLCNELNAALVATISYDNAITYAQIEAKTITEYNENCEVSVVIRDMWKRITDKLNNN